MHGIPAVHRFLSDERVAGFEPLIGRENVKRAVAHTLEEARVDGAPSFTFEDLLAKLIPALERTAADGLCGVVNGTGILLHTNLGRAPIAGEALEAALALGSGYSNLEFDLVEGTRGSRYSRAAGLVSEVTGCEDSIVVNNCAAAVLLVLDTFARGREVVIARNQLIEIGGGFRLPDVFERSGADLVEVGAANKVYLDDYERALTARTALLFRSHLSNFRMTGFTHEVPPAELVALGKRAGVPVVEDLGSGALVDLAAYGLPHERTVQEAVAEGVELVAFSADKLLGGPQAGIIAGKRRLISRLRTNPLLRALRVDKITLSLLAHTLRMYLSPQTVARIPLFTMLSATTAALRERAAAYCARLPAAAIVDCESYVGGGCMPECAVASVGLAFGDRTGSLAASLRASRRPVIGRNDAGRLLLDLRTIAPHEDQYVIEALKERT